MHVEESTSGQVENDGREGGALADAEAAEAAEEKAARLAALTAEQSAIPAESEESTSAYVEEAGRVAGVLMEAEAAEEKAARLAALSAEQEPAVPAESRWQAPPSEGISLLESTCFEASSELYRCRTAIVELDASARRLVADTEASSPNHESGRRYHADFVRSAEERKQLDMLMKEKTPAKIMVMGEMNSGKSMLINTMLRLGAGNKKSPGLLPSSNKPCTMHVTTLSYSDLPTVKFKVPSNADGQHIRQCEDQWTEVLREGRSLHGLLGRVEEGDDSPCVPDNVLQVELGLPLPALRGGIEIVDSPGLGENEDLNRLVRSHIKYDPAIGARQASAVLYILSAQSGGMKKEDRDALGRIEGDSRSRVMFVISKIDMLMGDQDEDDEEDQLDVSLASLFMDAQKLQFPLLVGYSAYTECPYFCQLSSKRTNWKKMRELEPLFKEFEASFITLLKPALWAPLASSSNSLIDRLSHSMSAYESFVLLGKQDMEKMLCDLRRARPEIERILKDKTKEMKAVLEDERSSLHTILNDKVAAFKRNREDAFLTQAIDFPVADSVLSNEKPTDDEKKKVSVRLTDHLQTWLVGEMSKDKAIFEAMQAYEKKLVQMSTALGTRLKMVQANAAQSLLEDTIKVTLMPVQADLDEQRGLHSGLVALGIYAWSVGGAAFLLGDLLASGSLWVVRSSVAATLTSIGGAAAILGATLTGVGLAAMAIAGGIWARKALGPFDWKAFKEDHAKKLLGQITAKCLKTSFTGIPKVLREGFTSELTKNEEHLNLKLQQEMHAWTTTKDAFRSKLNELELLRRWAMTSAVPINSCHVRPFSGMAIFHGLLGEEVQKEVPDSASSASISLQMRMQLIIDIPKDPSERQLLLSQMGFAMREAASLMRQVQFHEERVAMEKEDLPSAAELAAKKVSDAIFDNAESIEYEDETLEPRRQPKVVEKAKKASDAERERVIKEKSALLDDRLKACKRSMLSAFYVHGIFPVGSDGKETTPSEAERFRWLMQIPDAFVSLSSILDDMMHHSDLTQMPLTFAVHVAERIEQGEIALEAFVGTVCTICFPFGSPPEMQALVTASNREGTCISQASWTSAAVWCMGVLVHMLMTGGANPFKPSPRYDGSSVHDALRNGVCHLRNLCCGNKLVASCITIDPSSRPNFESIIHELLRLQAEQVDAERTAQAQSEVRTAAESSGFSLRLLDADKGDDGDLLTALQALLVTNRTWLGKGKDAQRKWIYDNLQLKAAWSVEHNASQASYCAGLTRITNEVEMFTIQGVSSTPGSVRRDEVFHCNAHVNETMLLHGLPPEQLLSVLSNGPNERFSGSNAGTAFGDGIYLAEDSGKSDQYSTVDQAYDADSELHQRLYQTINHPGNVFYVLVCRTVLGHSVRTLEFGKRATSMDTGKAIFPVSFRELAYVPGVSPPKFYHSLIGELGDVLQRYREFILFHGDQVKVEYLVAYQRYHGNVTVQMPRD